MVWGVPPGRGGLAPQASRHNSTREAGLDVGAAEVMGAGGGLAAELASGAAVAVGLGVGDELGLALGSFEQALTVATAKPAVPASWSSRRRLSAGAPSDQPVGGATMTVTIRKRGSRSR